MAVIVYLLVPKHAQMGIKFIYSAIAFNADMVFGNAGTAKKCSRTFISRPGINFHKCGLSFLCGRVPKVRKFEWVLKLLYPVSGSELRDTGYGLRVAGYELRVTSCGFRVAG